jgi:hypothetical protein
MPSIPIIIPNNFLPSRISIRNTPPFPPPPSMRLEISVYLVCLNREGEGLGLLAPWLQRSGEGELPAAAYQPHLLALDLLARRGLAPQGADPPPPFLGLASQGADPTPPPPIPRFSPTGCRPPLPPTPWFSPTECLPPPPPHSSV